MGLQVQQKQPRKGLLLKTLKNQIAEILMVNAYLIGFENIVIQNKHSTFNDNS